MAAPMTAVLAAFRQRLSGHLYDNLPDETALAEWDARRAELDEYWGWFSSEALDERATGKLVALAAKQEAPKRWPLRVNPIRTACRLHAYALWGEVEDDAAPLTELYVDAKDKAVEAAIQEAIAQVAYENAFRAMQMDTGLMSQALGGIVFKVGWEPDSPLLPSGVRWEYVDPRDFHAEWAGTDYWNLTKAWVRYTISAAEAYQRYGVEVAGRTALYAERWDRSGFRVTVDGHTAHDTRTGEPLDADHDLGRVPFVYIPHERTGSLWGTSVVPEAIGMTKEINSRLSDTGDAVRLNPHGPLVGKNIPNGYPQVKTLADGTKWIDLGRNLVQGAAEPDLDRVTPPQIPAGQASFLTLLIELARISMLTPDIAYGKEEGSQRSGQTLYNRMWPTLAHVRAERTNWTVGLNHLYELTLVLLARRGRLDIGEAHLGKRMRQRWAPMVPVDRMALVDEIVQLIGAGAMTPETGVVLAGRAADPEAEITRLKAIRAEAAERDMAQARPAAAKTRAAQPKAKPASDEE